MNRRLQQFLEAENITQAQFASKINVAPASISHILAGRNKPGYDFIKNTMHVFPELNIEWLIDGKGKMYKSLPPYNTPSGYTKEITATEKTTSGEGLLFAEDEDTVTPPDFKIPVTSVTPPANTQISETKNTPQPAVKIIEKQKKAVKIMVFYDDGTFQEFQ